jgi:large subunit ribosomal protein L22
MAIQAHATAKYVRTSAQKAGLVLDLIRGRDVNHAFATLRFARKAVARDIEKVLRSAVANAQQKDGFAGDVDQLFVAACYANQGPSQKRIRPAPMGRAFRIVKRTAHLTVEVAERPSKMLVEPVPGDTAGEASSKPGTKRKAKAGTKRKAKPGATRKAKTGGAKKKTAAKSGARKKAPARKKTASKG